MTDETPSQRPNKTQHKREADNLQDIGLQLLELSPDQLARLSPTQSLKEALTEAKRITQPEARRRHAQFIGKLMRQDDNRELVERLERLLDPSRKQRLAHWLNQFIATDDKATQQTLVSQLLDWYPHIDRQHLRNLIRNLQKQRPTEPSDGLPPAYKKAKSKLHRYLNTVDDTADW